MFCNKARRGGSPTKREGFESRPLEGLTHSSSRIDSVAISLYLNIVFQEIEEETNTACSTFDKISDRKPNKGAAQAN